MCPGENAYHREVNWEEWTVNSELTNQPTNLEKWISAGLAPGRKIEENFQLLKFISWKDGAVWT